MHGVVVTSNFSFTIASSWDLMSLKLTSSFSRVQRGEITAARFGISFPKYVIMPTNHGISLKEFGNGIFVTASIFAELAFYIQMIKHVQDKRRTLPQLNICFYLFSVHFYKTSFINSTLFKRPLCSTKFLPHTIILSWEVTLPRASEAMEVTSCWKTSLAE